MTPLSSEVLGVTSSEVRGVQATPDTVFVPASDAPLPPGGAASPPILFAVQPAWHLATLLAFRFCFVYFGLYVLTTQMLPSMFPMLNGAIPELDGTAPIRSIVAWVTAHILGISHPITYAESGSGDRTYDWALAFSLLLVAVLTTAVWSVTDRRRRGYPRLSSAFRLFLRFALGTTLVNYGLIKAVPLQMPAPLLAKLVQPFGTFSPMGVLWTSIGAAPAYEIFVGCAEALGGVLLFLPRTATLGALMCLADSIEVFTLNMTYDVPVKLFSLHLILLSLFLLAPNLRRLVDLLVLHRPVRLAGEPAIGQGPKAQRIAVIGQVVFGVLVLAANLFSSAGAWKHYGGGAPRSALYGIWEVEQMSIDEQLRPPLLTDAARWRRVIFDASGVVAIQRVTDSIEWHPGAINTTANTVTLTTYATGAPFARPAAHASRLTYQRQPAQGTVGPRLILDGNFEGHVVHVDLLLRDPESFLLRRRGFSWVQESPFNR